MNKKIYRHGDLIFKEIDKLPEGLKSVFVGCKWVAAEGETTGHRHLLTAEPTTRFEVLEDSQGQRYLKIEGSGNLSHEEHRTLEITHGFYVIGNEQEFDYFAEQTNRVID